MSRHEPEHHTSIETPWIAPTAAGAYAGVSANFLAKLRLRNEGPRYMRVSSGLIRYCKDWLDEWLLAQDAPKTSRPNAGRKRVEAA